MALRSEPRVWPASSPLNTEYCREKQSLSNSGTGSSPCVTPHKHNNNKKDVGVGCRWVCEGACLLREAAPVGVTSDRSLQFPEPWSQLWSCCIPNTPVSYDFYYPCHGWGWEAKWVWEMWRLLWNVRQKHTGDGDAGLGSPPCRTDLLRRHFAEVTGKTISWDTILQVPGTMNVSPCRGEGDPSTQRNWKDHSGPKSAQARGVLSPMLPGWATLPACMTLLQVTSKLGSLIMSQL